MPRTTDLAAVRAALLRDPVWSVYALADLAPPYAEHAEWRLGDAAVLLLYRAFQPPVMLAAGDVTALLGELGPEPEMYLSVPTATLAVLRAAGYRITHEKSMLRMALDERRFHPPPPCALARLGPEDEPAIRALFTPPFFDRAMLAHGVYFGARDETGLVALAGTHVAAPVEGVAAVGNVYTRPDRRGRGLASQTTAAVVAELLRAGVRTIALNVEAENAPAIRVYERLGFFVHCEYREAIALKS